MNAFKERELASSNLSLSQPTVPSHLGVIHAHRKAKSIFIMLQVDKAVNVAVLITSSGNLSVTKFHIFLPEMHNLHSAFAYKSFPENSLHGYIFRENFVVIKFCFKNCFIFCFGFSSKSFLILALHEINNNCV